MQVRSCAASVRFGRLLRESGMVDVVAVTLPSVAAEYQLAFERHWRDVFRFVLALTNDLGEAEDITQDAFARLWQARDGIDWSRPVLPWLPVVSRRLATDRFRRLARQVLGRPHQPSLDEMARARWLDVRDALGRLPTLERAALVLTTLEGWSYDELADVMQTTPGALRAAVSRARRKLEDGDASLRD